MNIKKSENVPIESLVERPKVFTEELKKMLAIYQSADQGKRREAKQQAKYFTGTKPSPAFKQVKKFIK